jgi:hypothetical protein
MTHGSRSAAQTNRVVRNELRRRLIQRARHGQAKLALLGKELLHGLAEFGVGCLDGHPQGRKEGGMEWILLYKVRYVISV